MPPAAKMAEPMRKGSGSKRIASMAKRGAYAETNSCNLIKRAPSGHRNRTTS